MKLKFQLRLSTLIVLVLLAGAYLGFNLYSRVERRIDFLDSAALFEGVDSDLKGWPFVHFEDRWERWNKDREAVERRPLPPAWSRKPSS